MYGSLKDYLKSVKTGKLPNPQLLLNQQQVLLGQTQRQQSPQLLQIPNGNVPGATTPAVVMSSVYPATNQQSTLSLCPYHHNQLTNAMSQSQVGGAPDNYHLRPAGTQAEESVSLYDMDPASRAHATRLLRLLNSEYCLQQLSDDHDCCSDGGAQGGATIKSGQSAYSYSRLGETCVRRQCLDEYPYWYGTLPRTNYYNSYYNHSEQKKERSESPLAETPGTNAPLLPPPVYINAYSDVSDPDDPQQECMCRQQTPNLNPYHNLSASNVCVYCCQCLNGEAGGTTAAGGDRVSLGGGAGSVPSDSERGLSYFEVLDFAQQIARGMEHLERMKVNLLHPLNVVITMLLTLLCCVLV